MTIVIGLECVGSILMWTGLIIAHAVITLRPRQNGRHFPDIFKCIFLNENVWIPVKISLKFVPKGPINNIPALHYLNQWWFVYRRIYASLGLNELKIQHCIQCGNCKDNLNLMHWPLGDMAMNLKVESSNTCYTSSWSFLWNVPKVNAREHLWWHWFRTSGNGLVPSGNKPLP